MADTTISVLSEDLSGKRLQAVCKGCFDKLDITGYKDEAGALAAAATWCSNHKCGNPAET